MMARLQVGSYHLPSVVSAPMHFQSTTYTLFFMFVEDGSTLGLVRSGNLCFAGHCICGKRLGGRCGESRDHN